MEKRITHVEAKYMSEDYIKSSGELRDIKIYGTKGAGFSMEINDSSGYCILKEPLKDIEKLSSRFNTQSQNVTNIPEGRNKKTDSEFGGYSSTSEWATKDPKGFTKHLEETVSGYIK